MKEKCEYCDFKIKEDEEYSKGKNIIDDCDVETYLQRECVNGKVVYYLTSGLYYSGECSAEVGYCPMCGRKLVK